MATYQSTCRKDRAISGFERLGQTVESQSYIKIGAACEARTEKNQHQQDQDECPELRNGVRAQIAVSLSFRCLPVKDCGGTCNRKQKDPMPWRISGHRALAQYSGEQREKSDGHGKAIPYEGFVVGVQMVVPRAERNRTYGNKKDEVTPAINGIRERRTLTERHCIHESHAGQANKQKKEVGCHIEKVWNAEKTPMIREIMVRGILRNSRKEKCSGDDCENRREQNPMPPTHRADGFGERRVSRIERKGEDICSMGAACSPKRADWYSSVNCATGAEISDDGIAAANSRGVCDSAFFQPRFSRRRSISRYSRAASDAVKFPARRARKLHRATT